MVRGVSSEANSNVSGDSGAAESTPIVEAPT